MLGSDGRLDPSHQTLAKRAGVKLTATRDAPKRLARVRFRHLDAAPDPRPSDRWARAADEQRSRAPGASLRSRFSTTSF